MKTVRTLTEGEMALVGNVFRDRVDCTRVKIHNGAWWLPEHGVAVSFCGRIYFPKRHYHEDFSREPLFLQRWFIHEITHVWQSQQGFPVLAAGVWLGLRGGYRKRRAYHYVRHCVAGGFTWMNMEQQADVLADYFVEISTKGESELEGVLCEFLSHAHDKSLLPCFWHEKTLREQAHSVD